MMKYQAEIWYEKLSNLIIKNYQTKVCRYQVKPKAEVNDAQLRRHADSSLFSQKFSQGKKVKILESGFVKSANDLYDETKICLFATSTV